MLVTALRIQALPDFGANLQVFFDQLELPELTKVEDHQINKVVSLEINRPDYFDSIDEMQKAQAEKEVLTPKEIKTLLSEAEGIITQTDEIEARLDRVTASLNSSKHGISSIDTEVAQGVSFDLNGYARKLAEHKVDVCEDYFSGGVKYSKDIYDLAFELSTKQRVEELLGKVYGI